MARTSIDEQLSYIAKIAADEDPPQPIKVRLATGLYSYHDSRWEGDRRPGHYLGFAESSQVERFHEALKLFVKACTQLPLVAITDALRDAFVAHGKDPNV